ncbi:hypothetical protein CJ179_38410 [Rhodococcus sp. ACS1]|uniref:hypothetical protein n=1 Tax=Rhodococcus sp. ACS1 TaxID=2028570 RepID=UPI000BB106DF|nr:hypothetical protein [Rhodococcus sp. ACS1]PBC38482.1 hypothetical protein CJ179_38410 [Rhodococcus sp. ACS1]
MNNESILLAVDELDAEEYFKQFQGLTKIPLRIFYEADKVPDGMVPRRHVYATPKAIYEIPDFWSRLRVIRGSFIRSRLPLPVA